MDIETKYHSDSLDLPGYTQAPLIIQPLAQRSMFWRPVYLEESSWLEHIPFAFWLIEAHRPRVFVELGAGDGAAYFAFCQAVEKLDLDSRCFAVDHWEDASADGSDEALFRKIHAHNKAQYSGFSQLLRSTCEESLAYFSDGSIDLLNLNGLQTSGELQSLFESWLPKLSDRAIVLIHQTNARSRRHDIFRVFESLKQRYPAFEFFQGEGLGVLGIGSEQSALLQRLFQVSASEGGLRAVHEVFSRLGQACADSLVASRRHESASGLKSQDVGMAGMQVHEQVLASQVDQLSRDLAFRNEELGSANDAVKQAQQKGLALHQQVLVRENQIAELRRKLEDSTSEQEKLQLVLAEQNAKLKEAQSELEQRGQQMVEIEKQLTGQSDEIEKLRREFTLGETVYHQLKQQIDELKTEIEVKNKNTQQHINEIASLTRFLGESEVELQTARQAADVQHQRADRLESELQAQNEVLKETQRQLAAAQKQAGSVQAEKSAAESRLEAENRKLRNEQQILTRRLDERFRELAILTKMLDEQGAGATASEGQKHETKSSSAGRRAEDSPGGLKVPLRDLVDTMRLPRGVKEQIAIIEQSGLFDRKWYLNEYPDVAESGANPLKHYIRFGVIDGRNPNPNFDTLHYMAKHPEVAKERINPLVHYIRKQNT